MQKSNNLSDLTNAATARTNLGLAIGTNVQAYDVDLSTIAGLTPTNNYAIIGNGTSWTSTALPSSGVTSVTGTSPVVSSGGTTPAISMAAANTTTNGYLTSTDWNTFNNKQGAGSYVTVGGALGTPSSGTLTNCTFPTLNQNTTGTASNVTGTVAVANGGTGATTLTANNVLLGNGTSTIQSVAPGTSGNVLTSNGTTWTSAAAGGGFPTGTVLLFYQAAAPTGWTQVTTQNNKALRIVSGTGGGTGGTTAFTTVFTNQTPTISGSFTIGNTTLSTAQMPSHAHNYGVPRGDGYNGSTGVGQGSNSNNNYVTDSQGGNGSHTHSISGSPSSSAITLNVQYIDIILASKN